MPAKKAQEEAKAQEPETKVEVAADAQVAPREQTVGDTQQPQVRVSVGGPLYNSGDQKAVVNPVLDTNAATIPYGYDEDGMLLADHFYKDTTYEVDPKLLEIKNTEGIELLVDPSTLGGGE